ncbi:MAG: DUF2938 family protein [Pseudobdellovibrio sp.]
MSIITGCIAGLIATLAMDCLGILTIRRKYLDLKGLQIVPPLLGRWTLAFFKPQVDIRQTPPNRYEKILGLIMHYLIGLALGVLYAFLPWHSLGPALIYGVLTNALPWVLMYPAMGFGFFASKLPIQKSLLLFSFNNHLMYGLALGLFFNFF